MPTQKLIPIAVAPAEVPAHATLSPSSSERWIACPGSVSASSNIEAKGASIYAAEGTAAHSLLEMVLRLDVDPDAFIGHEIEKGFKVTEEMAHAVGHALDYVRQEMERNPSLRLHIETRVKPGPLIGLRKGECEGTADIILEDGRLCIVIDYKHGAGIFVDVKDNSQLKLYAAGARERNGDAFFKYRIVIIQPRNYAANGKAVREWNTTERDLVEWLQNKVRPSAHAALAPNAPRYAGKWCKWCPAAGTCRVYAQHAASTAATEFGVFDPTAQYAVLSKPISKDQVKLDRPQDMTPEQLARALANVPMLQNWIVAVKDAAFDQLKKKHKLPGWKLGYGAKRRIWKPDPRIIQKITMALVKLGIKRDEMFSKPEFFSPPQMEQLLKDRNLWPAKPRNKDRPATPIDPFFEYSQPEPKIVPANYEEDRVGAAKAASHEFKPVSRRKA